MVKLPRFKTVEAEEVPVPTVLLNRAKLPEVPPKTSEPCPPASGAIVLAESVPPAPIETVPLFFNVLATATVATFNVPSLPTVTVPVPKAFAFLACKVPPEIVVPPL